MPLCLVTLQKWAKRNRPQRISPMKKPKISAADEEPDWPAIRARYEARDEAVVDIAISLGMKTHALKQHAKLQGWKMRSALRSRKPIKAKPVSARPPKP